MSLVVAPFGSSNDVVVPASGIVTAFSRGAFSVQVQNNPNANVPPVWSILAQVPANTVYTSSAFTAGAVIRIDASGGQEVSFDVGTAPGPLLGRATTVQGVVSSAVNTSATLTRTQMAGGHITSTTAAAVTATLPTGAVLDAQGVQDVAEGFYWIVQNTGGTNAITVATAANNVLSGSGAVAANSSGQFFTLKTGVGTYVTLRT
jgi:hypothetical protein